MCEYRSLNAIVAQSKHCLFRVTTAIELQNTTTTSDSNVIGRVMFQLASMPVLSDAAVTFFSSVVVLTPNGSFWIVPLLFAVSDINRSDQL